MLFDIMPTVQGCLIWPGLFCDSPGAAASPAQIQPEHVLVLKQFRTAPLEPVPAHLRHVPAVRYAKRPARILLEHLRYGCDHRVCNHESQKCKKELRCLMWQTRRASGRSRLTISYFFIGCCLIAWSSCRSTPQSVITKKIKESEEQRTVQSVSTSHEMV